MVAQAKIVAFAGSTRKDSFNKKLVRVVGAGAEAAGALVTYVDLREYVMPLYDGDFEALHGLPQEVLTFREILQAHHGFLIASPEYNSSVTAVLKNAIDWASRPNGSEAPLACFTGKTAAICSASPGALGGLRGLVHLRAILGNINVLVIPDQIAISQAHEAFGTDGKLIDQKKLQSCITIGEKIAKVTQKLLA